MQKHLTLLIICLALFGLALPASAGRPYDIRIDAYRSADSSGAALAVLTLTPGKGWHAYGNIPGPTGYPTTVNAVQSGRQLTVRYTPAESKPDPLEPDQTVELYEGPTPFFIELAAGDSSPVEITLNALLCSDTTCQPLRESMTLELAAAAPLSAAEEQPWWPLYRSARPGLEGGAAAEPEPAAVPAEQRESFSPRYFAPGLEVHTLSKAAVLAFLAGLILNFMPCVLPVITLKLRSFIPAVDSMPQHQRKAFQAHNLFFALGMMLYFLVLAGIIAATGMAWGQIFQKPGAIITLTAIVFALSLSLFGIYDLPLIDLKGRTRDTTHHPRLESFTTGVLATILATPCSGPFLGGVLAWALIQPPGIIALVLGCIGVGMASPYLAMAAFPGLYRFLPRPGGWTIHLERLLGFLLAATCVYLFGLLPTSEYLNVLILLWVVAMAAWVWGQWTNLNQTVRRRWAIRGTALAAIAVTAVLLFRPVDHTDPWRNFDMRQFRADLGQKNLILDFTADWCPNCKFLEKTVLTHENSAAIAAEYDAVLLRVDLTRQDPELEGLLLSLGSRSIPVLAIFSRDNPDSPLVLRDLFTNGQLREALDSELKP